LPGGFQEIGESLRQTAIRECREETGLNVTILVPLVMRSKPNRDPRKHVNAICYLGIVSDEELKAGDDADEAKVFKLDSLPKLAFDHEMCVKKFFGEIVNES